ncbi:MAG: hypothetical protein OSJ65_01130 [Bacilli bacterium]|nr:hypothetical protein [Bacilli bacterium]
MNNEKYKDCFTEIEEGKINADFNNATVSCISSKNNKFSMDSEGNLVVNSITTRENNNLETNFDAIYPIGSFYFTSSNTNPSALFGGAWRQIKDRFILSCGDKYANGSTGGEENHTLNIDEMPNHNHEIRTNIVHGDGPIVNQEILNAGIFAGEGRNRLCSDCFGAGGNQPHNNMPPYLAIYVWERIS